MSTRSLSRNCKAPISLTMLCAFLALAASAMASLPKGSRKMGTARTERFLVITDSPSKG